MFNLIKTFKNDKGFRITPILLGDTPIFLTNEVQEQLGYSDLSHSIRNSDGFVEGVDYLVLDGDKLKHLKQLLHGVSQTASVKIMPQVSSLIVLTESGLIATAIKSTKKECIEFRVWITKEVIPSILKTGSYSIENQDIHKNEYAHSVLNTWLKAAKLLNVPTHLAETEAIKQAKLKTDVDFSPLLLQSPSQDNIKPDEIYLEPTELGKKLGISGIAMNRFLEETGMQTKINSDWIPTDKGKNLVSKGRHHWVNGTKSGYNWKWNVEKVLELWQNTKMGF